jgi:hypothetical protein
MLISMESCADLLDAQQTGANYALPCFLELESSNIIACATQKIE